MKDRGNLLVTTKSGAAGRKTFICIACSLLILVGIFIMANPRAFYELSHAHYRLIAIVLGMGMIAYDAYLLLVTFWGSRSYCEVYEYTIVGMTALSRNQPNMPMQKFDISYADIHNVTESGRMILIYTPYATYEVLALQNRSEAVDEIRKRMSGNAK